jgi:hypothetical protein
MSPFAERRFHRTKAFALGDRAKTGSSEHGQPAGDSGGAFAPALEAAASSSF